MGLKKPVDFTRKKVEGALRRVLPIRLLIWINNITSTCRKILYRRVPRPRRFAETSKAKERRRREGFFEIFCQGRGLDIGYGGDLLAENCRGWDIEDGDAQTLEGLKDREFDFVYSSHTLEHVDNVESTLRNWYRVLKPGGYLILYLPDRNLFEKKRTLPSRWNETHRHFFLLDRDELPDTVGVIPLIERALSGYQILQARVCDEGYESMGPKGHSKGEYSIEVIIRKD
jgi:SAM-dependent methyltransferase